MKFLMGTTVAFILICLIIAIYAVVHENNECLDKGGEMVGTGNYVTSYVKTGNSIIPITSETQACSK